jgi:hypothetical protein
MQSCTSSLCSSWAFGNRSLYMSLAGRGSVFVLISGCHHCAPWCRIKQHDCCEVKSCRWFFESLLILTPWLHFLTYSTCLFIVFFLLHIGHAQPSLKRAQGATLAVLNTWQIAWASIIIRRVVQKIQWMRHVLGALTKQTLDE